jgi:hypothetical protein
MILREHELDGLCINIWAKETISSQASVEHFAM